MKEIITRKRILESATYNTNATSSISMRELDTVVLTSVNDLKLIEDLLEEDIKEAISENLAFIENDIKAKLDFCFWFDKNGYLVFER